MSILVGVSSSKVIRGPFPKVKQPELENTHFHLLWRLKIRGALSPVSPYIAQHDI
jgi:hypothetical protein